MTRFVVGDRDGTPKVIVGQTLLVNFGLGRVTISTREDGSIDVSIVEDAEGTIRSETIDMRGWRDS